MTKYEVKRTSTFKKDYKRITKQGLPREEIEAVVRVLAEGEPLNKKYRDHALSGIWKGHRGCHIRPDWVLIYKYIDDVLVLSLSRTGSHSEVYDM